jgi:hypothetical protein
MKETMPPRVTIAYGRNFHFFREMHESNYVYLELEDAPYEAGYRHVMVAIPVDVWGTLRSLAPVELDLINTSDTELIELVEARVSKRIMEYESVRSSNPEKAELIRFNESIKFGPADAEREVQLARGLSYYKSERERQRAIAARIAQHKIIEIATES